MKIRDREIGWPVAIAAAVAVISMAAFLIVEFGSGKHKQAPDSEATKAAAQSAGAKVIPTQPKLVLEPVPPGPKPVQPAAPAAGN